jgi:hypothetical protein
MLGDQGQRQPSRVPERINEFGFRARREARNLDGVDAGAISRLFDSNGCQFAFTFADELSCQPELE